MRYRKALLGSSIASVLMLLAQTAGGQDAKFPSNDVLRAQNVALIVDGFVFGGGVTRQPDGKLSGNGTETIPQQWSGSGFLVDDQGTLITNFHVAARARQVKAKFDDGATFEINHLRVYDPDNDLAVLKISGTRRFQPVFMGNSNTVDLRDPVLAVGNAGDTGLNVTDGKISRVLKNRDGQVAFLQHTAPIAPGSSGGALYRGQDVIGVNVSMFNQGQFGQAVPINRVKELLSDNHGKNFTQIETVFDPTRVIESGLIEEIGSVSEEVSRANTDDPGIYEVKATLDPLGDYVILVNNADGSDLDILVKNRNSGDVIGYANSEDSQSELLFMTAETGADISIGVLNYSRRDTPFVLTLGKFIW